MRQEVEVGKQGSRVCVVNRIRAILDLVKAREFTRGYFQLILAP